MLHFLLDIIIMTRSTKTRLLLRDKCKVVHSDRLYRPVFTSITEESVLHIIDSLKPNTSTGVNGISNKLCKFVKCGIAKLFTIIINQMLSVGILPDLLKIFRVIPLHKKNDSAIFLIIDQFRLCFQHLI